MVDAKLPKILACDGAEDFQPRDHAQGGDLPLRKPYRRRCTGAHISRGLKPAWRLAVSVELMNRAQCPSQPLVDLVVAERVVRRIAALWLLEQSTTILGLFDSTLGC